ncbi:Rieske 2Fe-2S domain-containing protein [Streptomyces xanthochromogenes]|uniref:Rieske 2Fe-2S domain-containing protein n=1 Tax=Streptomyces xanthochromogenes TaxID=67384 RepID=UPI003826778F
MKEYAPAAGSTLPARLPYPNGWFCLGQTREIPPGTVITRPFMGGDLVLYRTRSGKLCAVRPYCPHLGAHLGVGGRIDGELLVCPFHKFAYDTTGQCARTPYGKPPRNTSLTRHDVQEKAGLVWVWHHSDGMAPTWSLPDLPVYGAHPAVRSTRLSGHPQEFLENTADTGHGRELHGWSSFIVEVLTRPTDPVMRLKGSVVSRIPVLGKFRQEFDLTAIGLAGSQIHFSSFGGRLKATTFALATPVSPWEVRLWLISSGALRPSFGIGTRVVSQLMLAWVWQQATAEIPIWNHKKYLPHPRLNSEDGPIGPFRVWARQFYSKSEGDQLDPMIGNAVTHRVEKTSSREKHHDDLEVS